MSEPTKETAPAAEADMAVSESAQSAQAGPPAPNSENTAISPDPPATSPEKIAVSQSLPASQQANTVVSQGPTWPDVLADSPLAKLIEKTPQLIQDADYDEVFGIHLNGPSKFCRNLILQKFLRANANDVEQASAQLLSTLEWRKGFQPLETVKDTFSATRFGGLGYVTTITDVPESTNKEEVVCFNVYGAVKDNKATFEDIEGFMRWRVALMELSLSKLDLASATKPIPNYGEGPDPYQCIQVHDYLNVSFLRRDPYSKKAASDTIELFKQYYPETMSRKFFVNVLTIMGWVFSAVKLVLSKETVKKFTVLTYGKDLAGELGPNVPEVYGGKGGKLEDAERLKLEG